MTYLCSVYFITIKNEIKVTRKSNLKEKNAEQTMILLGLYYFRNCLNIPSEGENS